MRRNNRIPWVVKRTLYRDDNPRLRSHRDYVVTNGRETWETQMGPCFSRRIAQAVADALNAAQQTRGAPRKGSGDRRP